MSLPMKRLLIGAITVITTASAVCAHAQSPGYPVRPVRVIVPFVAGGGADLMARQIASKLSERLGQQFVIDNRGGGGGLIGMELTATAAPDGYTVLFSSASYAAAMALRQSSYGMLSSLVPVSHVAAAPYVVTVHPSLPTTMQGLLDLARAKPGDLGYASTGIGGLTHLATELLLSMAKVRMTHVPYKGAGAAMPDVLAGRTPVLINPAISMVGHYQTGRLRPLAVTGSTRLPDLPDVPPVQDTVPGYVVYTWYGIFAPRGTPGSAIGVLNTTMNRILDEREVKKNFLSQGAEVTGGAPALLGKIVREDYERWAKVVRDNKITAD